MRARPRVIKIDYVSGLLKMAECGDSVPDLILLSGGKMMGFVRRYLCWIHTCIEIEATRYNLRLVDFTGKP
jgi:hypothetical protein